MNSNLTFINPNSYVGLTNGVNYTVPLNGFLMAQCFRNSTTGTEAIALSINGKSLQFTPQATDYGRSQLYLNVKKGWTINISGIQSAYIYFFG